MVVVGHPTRAAPSARISPTTLFSRDRRSAASGEIYYRIMTIKKLAAVCVAGAFALPYAYGVTIDNSTYRIGSSHDGNLHDRDDFAACAMECALIGEAGLNAKFVHIDVNDHLGGNDPGWASTMWSNTTGAISRWNLTTVKAFNDQSNLSGALSSMREQINASNAGNRFYLSCAGPMEVPWRAINGSNSAARQFCTAVSHSTWNDNHTHGSASTHTWKDIQNSGVKTVHITDQNSHAFKSNFSEYAWLKNSSNANWQWLYTRAVTATYDASDAGIIWYIITGRGDQTPSIASVHDLFDGKFTYTGGGGGGGDGGVGTSPGTYQAEKATLAGGAILETLHAGFHSTGYINFSLDGGSATISNVDGGTGGAKTLVIRYALGKPARTGLLVVNGANTGITFSTTGDWTSWNTQTVPVTLKSGATNTIVLKSNGQDLANIDEITVK